MGRPVTPLVLDAFGGADVFQGRLRKSGSLPFIMFCRNLTQNPSGRKLAQTELDRHGYLLVVILFRGFLMHAAGYNII